MLVAQLVELLLKQPQHKECMIDVSPSQADYFVFAPVVDVDEGQLDDDSIETVVLILPFKVEDVEDGQNTARFN